MAVYAYRHSDHKLIFYSYFRIVASQWRKDPVNSEELEQSLKAEFENYLKQVIAEMRDDVTEFQIKIESEFEKHKSHIDEAFNGFSARFDSEHTFDEGFRESVVEHMRLARDEGAKITATAITNAEEMERLAPPEFNLADIKEAVIDISS